MAYVQFGPDNISCSYSSSTEEPIGEDWYQVPEGDENKTFYKLDGGKVVPLTNEEVQEYHKSLVSSAQINDVKMTVSEILFRTDWLVSRHNEQVALGGNTSLSEEEFTKLIQYRSDLRALSNSESVTFPIEYPEYPLASRYPLRMNGTFDQIPNPTDFATEELTPPEGLVGG